jgi:hypothetical protein
MQGRLFRVAFAIVLCTFYFLSFQALAQPSGQWPHTITENGASVTVYQPQAMSWPDEKQLTARAAIAIKPAGTTQEILGTIEVSLTTSVDQATRTVHLSNPQLLSSHFPALDTKRATELDAKIRAALPHMQVRQVALDAVLLSLKQPLSVSPVAVNNDPPAIFYSSHPASLVVFDGAPVLAPAGKSGLSFAVNTNWDVFTDNSQWYLLNNGLWLSAPAATGPYAPARTLPSSFSKLPADANFAEARKHVPARPPKPGEPAPVIFVSTKPAEIIVTNGPPQYDSVPGTNLERVKNTISILYHDRAQGTFFYLVSGRWFAATSLEGPWGFATDNLPPDFAALPEAGTDATALASVPGTVQAEEAVLKAQIPTTAALKRSSATLTVAYSGPPQFKPIPGTPILYAVNTNYEVLKIGDVYYACYQGAWFISNSPTGPWVLTSVVPEVIYTIPPTSPVYPVTYVRVYSASPTAITFGYTAGYTMGFVSAGVMVFGTGYYYPPVVVPGPVPAFYPYPYTYAGNVWYNPATSAWTRGGTVYGPYGAATGGRYYNPAAGGWAQGGVIYGPNGGADAWSYYNPRTGSYARGSAVWGGGSGTANASFYGARYGISGSTNQNVNPYSRWGSSTFAGPNKTINTQSRGNANGAVGGFSSSTGAAGAGYHNRVTGSSGGVVKGAGDNVYAGRDGNVYRRTDSGWSKWDNGGWQTVNPPKTSTNATGTSSFQGRRPSTTGQSLGGTQGASAQGRYRSQVDPETYHQLQYDRVGREAGMQNFAGLGGARGEGAHFGGGRFRR